MNIIARLTYFTCVTNILIVSIFYFITNFTYDISYL